MTLYTVTLNPTLDKTLSVAALRPGEVHRSQLVRQDLGGKGINVSRALRELGIESEIVAVFAGATGQRMHQDLGEAGFACHVIWVEGETRQNLTLRDDSQNLYTKINEPGPKLTPEHVSELRQLIEQLAAPDDIWAFSGSLPPGAATDLYANLIELAQNKGSRAFLDTSGPALQAGLQARPYAIKPNSEEIEDILGYIPVGDQIHCQAVRQLLDFGIEVVALSRGSDGLILGHDQTILKATPPTIDARSPIGAGDATLAGLIWATLNGCDPTETACRAVACGTAAAMQEGTALGKYPLIQQLCERVEISTCLARNTQHATRKPE
ncbi:MAG: 1-phosphofructokinase [Chloroflexi bacterium]|nr:1-phosphofructokinase [Chloroflexota bacterium]